MATASSGARWVRVALHLVTWQLLCRFRLWLPSECDGLRPLAAVTQVILPPPPLLVVLSMQAGCGSHIADDDRGASKLRLTDDLVALVRLVS